MADDIVTQLRKIAPIHEGRKGHGCIADAADEIERLRAALALAVGELSTHSQHRLTTPDMLMQQFLEEARRG